MIRLARMVGIASALALVLPLAACADFYPQDALESVFSSQKKPLPGDRKALFPEGTPGVRQGVPADLVKGYQPPPEAPPPVVEAKTEKKAKKKKAAEAPAPRKQARKKAQPEEEIEPGDQPMQQAPAARTTTQPVQQAPGGFQTMPGAQPTWPSNAQPVPTR